MYAVIDIETTGGSPQTTRITEVAIVLHNGKKQIETYRTLVNPEQPIAPFVIELTGITDEMVAEAPLFSQVADKIDELTQGKIIVAHNSKFDYGFLQNEFRRLHKRFQRTHICTVTMSQQLLPGYPSYSLGRLCEQLNISLENKHRALDDAIATSQLFELLMQTDDQERLLSFLEDDFTRAEFPKHIDQNLIQNLPEDIGVYFILDKNHEPIFIQKTKNIRNRVISHFLPQNKNSKSTEIRHNAYSVDFILTGSELLSELIEREEIIQHNPRLNSFKKKFYKHGIYSYEDKNGYLRLKNQHNSIGSEPLIEFTSKKMAQSALTKLEKKYHLNQRTRLNTSPKEYNITVENALLTFHYDHPNFFLVEQGRVHNELSIVAIQNGKYYGYGFIDATYLKEASLSEVFDSVKKKEYSTENQQIIRKRLKRRGKVKIIPFDSVLEQIEKG